MEPGKTINNATLRETFAVGNMGGMRRSMKNNLLVIVSDHTKGLYDDRWESDVLHYTGMGTIGAQVLHHAQNRTLHESRTNGVTVHLFEVFQPGQYVYAGEVELVDEPYQEEQADNKGQLRLVWMFPLKLKPGGLRPVPKAVIVRELDAAKQKALAKKPLPDLKRLAKKAKAITSKRPARVDQFIRNPYVAAYVKKAANGHCDLCKEEAPFVVDGQPFLHCHHILWLAQGGPDIIQNAVALCPNCHERMHQLDQEKDIKRLVRRAAERDPDLPEFEFQNRTLKRIGQ